MLSVLELQRGIIDGSRRHLAKAITLVESKRPEDREQSLKLLEALYTQRKPSQKIGISGSPGVGKSTFIESFGKLFLDDSRKLAVLTVDPSSPRSSGSILGDKTRMEELARQSNCFIRPSPAGLSLGGVARHTREVIILCEAAGFDSIVIETVGVGQSEHLVSTMVDVFVFLSLPHAGDQLQGIKRGILELCDLVVITKADGELEVPAKQAKIDHEMALHYLHHDINRISPIVFTCSAFKNTGFQEIYSSLNKRFDELNTTGRLMEKRKHQTKEWYESEILDQFIDKMRLSPKFQSELDTTESELFSFKIPPPVAAAKLIKKFVDRIEI